MEVFQGSDLDELTDEMFAKMKTQIENTKFKIDKILFLDVNCHKLKLTRGSSYLLLPDSLSKKNALINQNNEEDEECFKWAVIASLHHEEIKTKVQRISKLKKFESRHNWERLEYQVAINKIDKFKKGNPEIVVNILSKDNGIYICRRSKHTDRKNDVNLLLISGREENYYTAIKNFSRLLSKDNSKNKER